MHRGSAVNGFWVVAVGLMMTLWTGTLARPKEPKIQPTDESPCDQYKDLSDEVYGLCTVYCEDTNCLNITTAMQRKICNDVGRTLSESATRAFNLTFCVNPDVFCVGPVREANAVWWMILVLVVLAGALLAGALLVVILLRKIRDWLWRRNKQD